MLSFSLNVKALRRDSDALINRSVCTKIELAKANSDGTLTSISCYDNYNAAKSKMDESDDKTLIILERNSNKTKVIDAKYALVYLDRGDVLTYLYSTSSFSNELTYMNNSKNYGATDGAFLGIDYSNKAAKIRIGGVTGWVKNGQYTIIPWSWVKSHSYYLIEDRGISHFYVKDIENTGYTQSSRLLGPKPIQELANRVHLSYDGIYLYTSFFDMIDDYRENGHSRSVNSDKAYYNYYLYLPHRSKTNYDIDDFDAYIRGVLNFNGSLYGKFLSDNKSMLYGASEYFMYAEKMYGANALLVFSLSRNESDNGRSWISYTKNNIFGHMAYDGSAASSSATYLDIRTGIYKHGYSYINYGYSRVADYRYHGSHLGNKNTGMNVMYASDVFWSEKAASYAYSFDKSNGMLDYNYYQLILSTTSGVNVRVKPNTSSAVVYQVKQANLPFILIEEVEGEDVGGNNIWYKIQSDSNVNDLGQLINSNDSWPAYNWDGYLYVHSSYFIKINDAKKEDGTYNSPLSVDKSINNYQIVTNVSNNVYTPIVGKVLADTDYFYTSTLISKKGTITKDNVVVILEKAIIGDEVNYLVITDYGTYQKAWISGQNIEIIDRDLLSVNTGANAYITVYNKVGGTSVLNVYDGNFLPIIGKEIANNKTYLKVIYKLDGSVGYVDSSLNNIKYTLNYLNTLPEIIVNDINILLNTTFNPLDYVQANDKEDGDITNLVQVIENKVNTSVIGSYSVTYSVMDSYGDTTTKKVMVNVYKMDQTDALFMYNNLKHIEDNKFEFSGFMGIKGMNNIHVNSTLIFVNELNNEEYTYNLSKWDDYPYEMSSLDDKTKYDYSGGWFKEIVDLTNLPNGDYTIYVETENEGRSVRTIFTNIAYMEMERRVIGLNKEYFIEVDYSTINSPLLFSVRNTLISLDVPKTIDPMYNFFTEISLNEDILIIKGTSHNINVSYGIEDNVVRRLILENKTNFSRYEYDLGSITNGDYPITLAVSDNCDKTRAWYFNTIDLSTLASGEYILYIKNSVNGLSYYGEIIDVAYTDFSSINNTKYQLVRNDNRRLRLEIIKN